MKAIIWKEWRETLPWAVFALLGLFVAAWMVHDAVAQFSIQSLQAQVPAWPMIGGALIASALGMHQIMKEQRRDQWAFLIHRPATPTTLFVGKAVAGLSLYCAVLLIPLFAHAWWLATPGNVAAPFHADILLPAIADIFAGALFYFAGMLAALRAARWYATKIIGFATACLGAAVAYSSVEFWHALLSSLIFMAPLALAAWGAFLRPGAYDSQPRIARIGTTLTLFLACDFLLTWVALKPVMDIVKPKYPLQTAYRVSREGDIFRVTTRPGQSGSPIVQVTDLHGATVKPFNGMDWRREDFAWMYPVPAQSTDTPYRLRSRYLRMRDKLTLTATKPSDEAWFFDKATGRLLGYSRLTRLPIGSITPAGFTPTGASLSKESGFSLVDYHGIDIYDWDMLIGEHSFTTVDLAKRQTKTTPLVPEDESILGAIPTFDGYGPLQSILAFTTKRAIVTDGQGRILRSVPLPERPGGILHIASPYWPGPFAAIQDTAPRWATVSDGASGASTTPLPPLPKTPAHADAFLFAATRAPAQIALHDILGGLRMPTFVDDAYPQAMQSSSRPALLGFSLVLALICALLAAFIGRLCRFSSRQWLPWTLGVFLLGLPGLLMLLALRG